MEKRVLADLFLYFTIAYIAGVGIVSFTNAGFSFGIFCIVLGLAIVGLRFIKQNNVSTYFYTVTLIICFACSVASIRYAMKEFYIVSSSLSALEGQKITLEGIILEEPKDRDQYIQYLLYSNTYDERIIVRSERIPVFKYGDQVEFSGDLSQVEPFSDEKGKIVFYDKILSTKDIYFVLSRANGKLIEQGKGNSFRSFLYTSKQNFIDHVNRVVSEPYSTLIAGVVFGSDDTLGKDSDEMFKTAGITHIIVLSGYNLALLATAILYLFRFLPLHVRTLCAIVFIVLFALMTGGGASVFRASLMACMALIATAFGRKHLAGRILIIAAGCMLLINPKLLRYDLGFQLSFIATAALIWLAPFVYKKCTLITGSFGIREVLASSLAVHLAVIPLLFEVFGSVSLFGIFANILVLPFVPLLMMLGIIIGFLGFISTVLTIPFAFFAWGISVYIFIIARFFSVIPFARLDQGPILTLFLFCIYSACIYWIFPQIINTMRTFCTHGVYKLKQFIQENQ